MKSIAKKFFCLVAALVFFFIQSGSYAVYNDNNIYGGYLISTAKKKISMDLENASLVDVLKVLSQQTGLNFVSSEAVSNRKLTLYLDKVPLKSAMDTIFLANNLSYDFYPESQIFIVKDLGNPAIELKTKVYPLKYARLKSGRMDKEVSDEMGGTGKGGISEAVKGVLSSHGSVVEDPRTNSLVVTDTPLRFSRIEAVIASLDVPIPKVMIEVEILDVAKTLADELGVDWSSNGLGAFFTSTLTRTTHFPLPGSLVSSKGVSGGTSTWGLGPTTAGLTAALKFLHTDTTTKTLARPKILTLSGETAELNLKTDEAIGITTTTDDNGNVNQDIERADTGTIFRVTPRVNMSTREITMFLEPKVTEAIDSGLTLNPTANISGNVKNIEERGIKTTLVLHDGDTLMIGGLLKDKDKVENDKIPLLGDIPLIGALFRYKSKGENGTTQQRELLIFLTPRIITDENSDTQIANSEFKEMREQSFGIRQESIDKALAKFQ